MGINEVLLFLQVILSLLLTILILIQARGTGIGQTFGGGNVSFTRRGVEKAIFKLTFVVTALFILTAFILLIV